MPTTSQLANAATAPLSRAAHSSPPLPRSMRAVVQRRYGSAAQLQLDAQHALPEPGPGEVLVRVHAAPVHQGDWHLMRGEPLIVRAMGFGLRRPKAVIPGIYGAGVVVAVGPGVSSQRVGEQALRDPARRIRRVRRRARR